MPLNAHQLTSIVLDGSDDYSTDPEDEEEAEEIEDKNKEQSAFLKLPNEMVQAIFRWTDFESREALRDVCQRLRFLIDEGERAISLDSLTFSRRQSLDPNTFTKYFNLRVLDLIRISMTSMHSTMADNRERTKFAQHMARDCPLIQDLKIQGILGCKWLATYSRCLNKECKIRTLHVDMVQGYIGCMTALNQTLPFLLELKSLNLLCSGIRRSTRFQSLTAKCFDLLADRLTSFTTNFPRNQYDIDSLAIPRLSGLEFLQVGTVSGEQLTEILERNPGLKKLRLGVNSDSFPVMSSFKDLERLSLTMQSPIPGLLFRSIFKCLIKLKVLEIVFTPHMAEASISGIAQCPDLEVLIVAGCVFLASNALFSEVKQLENLRELIVPDWVEPLLSTGDGAPTSKLADAVGRLSLSCPKLERFETVVGRFTRQKDGFVLEQSVRSLAHIRDEKFF